MSMLQGNSISTPDKRCFCFTWSKVTQMQSTCLRTDYSYKKGSNSLTCLLKKHSEQHMFYRSGSQTRQPYILETEICKVSHGHKKDWWLNAHLMRVLEICVFCCLGSLLRCLRCLVGRMLRQTWLSPSAVPETPWNTPLGVTHLFSEKMFHFTSFICLHVSCQNYNWLSLQLQKGVKWELPVKKYY